MENIANKKKAFFEHVYCVDGVLQTELDGEVALMSVETGKYFSLNGTASRIWQVLKEEPRIEIVINRLSDIYDFERPQLDNEIYDLLYELENECLVTLT